MKIACNYYRETEQLLDEKRIAIDYFKYPGLGFQMKLMEDPDAFERFCKRITKKRPMLLHGLYPAPHDLSLASMRAGFDDTVAGRLIRITETPGLSFHPALSKTAAETPFRETLDTIINNAGFLKEKYAGMRFVSIKNMDVISWGDLLKPEIMTQIVRESGCEFLLDISHAYCASACLNLPFYDYLTRLPLEKTVEIHINGWMEAPNDIMCHTKINEAGYQALEFVLGHCRPEVITVEYGRSDDRIGAGVPILSPDCVNEQAKQEIEEQLYRIHEICAKCKR